MIKPLHLPDKLTIVYWGWDWLTFSTDDEPWGNVDSAMRECKERGYNAVRADIGPDFMYTGDQKRRGLVSFAQSVKGGLKNCHCVNEKGGGTFDMFDRAISLFEAAAKYDMYVIPTTWEYQDAINHLADAKLREALLGVPLRQRLMHVSILESVFLKELEQRGLLSRIAYFENYNEINCDFYSIAKDDRKRMVEESLDYLRQRFPELVYSADYGVVDYESIADNTDLVDVHPYTSYIMGEILALTGVSDDPSFPNAENNYLQMLLIDHPETWKHFKERAQDARSFWHPLWYFYENLDNQKYDELCFKLYQEKGEKIISQIAVPLAEAAGFAKARGLGVVVDEGYIFYPPYLSRFEETEPGQYISRAAGDICTRLNYWGFIPSGYTRPNTRSWYNDSHCDILRTINGNFQKGLLNMP